MNNMNYPSICICKGSDSRAIIYMCPLACRQEHWDRQELYTYVRLSITQFSISMQVVSSNSLKSFSRVWAKLHIQEAKKLSPVHHILHPLELHGAGLSIMDKYETWSDINGGIFIIGNQIISQFQCLCWISRAFKDCSCIRLESYVVEDEVKKMLHGWVHVTFIA